MSETAKKTFGQNVYRLRSAGGLTQERLAERADLSRRYVQEMESGTKFPTVPVLARLRRALDCSWDELLAGV